MTDAYLVGAVRVPVGRYGGALARVHVGGGAIALGHALSSSGSPMIVPLPGRLDRSGGSKDLATLCDGGRQGQRAFVARV